MRLLGSKAVVLKKKRSRLLVLKLKVTKVVGLPLVFWGLGRGLLPLLI